MAMTFEVGGRKRGFGRETFIKAMTESGIGEKVAANLTFFAQDSKSGHPVGRPLCALRPLVFKTQIFR